MKKNNGRGLINSLILVGISYSLSLVLWTFWYFGFDRSITVHDSFWERLWNNSDVFYFIIWFVPAFLLLLFASVNKSRTVLAEISFENLFSNRFSFKNTIIGIVVLFIIIFGIKLLRTGTDFSMISVTFKMVRSALLASVMEEFIFRASYQNILRMRLNKQIAFLVIAVLFLVCHFPDWAFAGMLGVMLSKGLFLIHIFVSLFFSFSFEKSKNIALPMIFHFFWNLFAGIFKV